jgi:sec-independent protein translocase protein TatA
MGIGWQELVLILAIALVIFGAKRLRSLGSDLGGAIKSFKTAMREEEEKPKIETSPDNKQVSNQSGEKTKFN